MMEEYIDIARLCRVCMKLKSETSAEYRDLSERLFPQINKIIDLENDNITVGDALEQITSLKFHQNDHLPQNICRICEKTLAEAIILVQQAKDSAAAYKKIVEGISIKDIAVVEKREVPMEKHVENYVLIKSDTGELANDPELILTNVEILSLDEEHKRHENLEQLQIEKVETLCRKPLGIGLFAEDAVSFILNVDKAKNIKLTEDSLAAERQRPVTSAQVKYEDRRYACDLCPKRFLRKSNLIDHIRFHKNERQFKCNVCGKEFIQSGNFKSHMRVHTKERPYECHLCGRTYNQSGALKVHIRSHTNERNHICDMCSKGFTNASDLTKHKRVHFPDKMFKCDICSRRFAQRGNLRHHFINHHTGKNDKQTNNVLLAPTSQL